MRIDKYLSVQLGSRTRAAQAVAEGLVKVNGKIVRPSYEVEDGDDITVETKSESYVSNGGYKLAKALKDFNFDVSGNVVADIGASTGGFTDCLLQNGAKKVYCIDVGENQLDPKICREKIVIIDNFNARNMRADLFAERLDGVVVDVSFISLTIILDAVCDVLCDAKYIIALIKPQFEFDKKKVGKNGIVRDAALHRAAIKKIYDYAAALNLAPSKLTNAPIREGKNKEYLILLIKNGYAIAFNELIKYVEL